MLYPFCEVRHEPQATCWFTPEIHDMMFSKPLYQEWVWNGITWCWSQSQSIKSDFNLSPIRQLYQGHKCQPTVSIHLWIVLHMNNQLVYPFGDKSDCAFDNHKMKETNTYCNDPLPQCQIIVAVLQGDIDENIGPIKTPRNLKGETLVLRM